MKVDHHISLTFKWLQFVLAAIVVMCHAQDDYARIAEPGYLTFIIPGMSPALMQTFFLISGYLFFIGRKSFGPREYLYVLRHRTRTLILPYLIWCAIAVCISDFQSIPDIITDPVKLKELFWAGHVERYTATPFRTVIQNIAYPDSLGTLWYVRDLIIMIILSPIVWLIGMVNPRISLPILLTLALLHLGIPYVGSLAPVWFSIGAVVATHRIDCVSICHRLGWKVIIPWLILAIVYGVITRDFDKHHLFHGPKSILAYTLNSILGVGAFFAMASRSLYPGKKAPAQRTATYAATRINSWLIKLAPCSFFIYVAHNLPCIDSNFYLLNSFIDDPFWQESAAFIVTVILKLTLIPLIFFVMRRYTPRGLSIITGGRSSKTFQSPSKLLTLQSESPNC